MASVDDIAKSLGMSINGLWTIPNLATGMSYLKRIGAQVGEVSQIKSISDISRLVPRDGSVLMLAVRVMDHNKVIGGHAIYAFRNSFGQIRYMDRTVNGTTTSIYKEIAEIAPRYGAKALVPYEAAVIKNVFVKTFAHDIPRLVIPLLGVMATKEKP